MSEFYILILSYEEKISLKNQCKSDIRIGNVTSHTQIVPHIYAFDTNKPDVFFK